MVSQCLFCFQDLPGKRTVRRDGSLHNWTIFPSPHKWEWILEGKTSSPPLTLVEEISRTQANSGPLRVDWQDIGRFWSPRRKNNEKEVALSKKKHAVAYQDYLLEKSRVDAERRDFYLQEKWRLWKFRIYCRRRRQVVKQNRTDVWTFLHGDWSSSRQQKGCDPSPTVGIRKLLSKRFKLKDVDEFRTSKVCNTCKGELKGYRKRGGGSPTPDCSVPHVHPD